MTLSPAEKEVVAARTPLHVSEQEGGFDTKLVGKDVGTISPDD